MNEIDLRSFLLGVMVVLTPSMLTLAWLLLRRSIIIEFEEEEDESQDEQSEQRR